MAGSINKVILVGNLGADPKVSNTASGTKIVNLNIATSDSWKDKVSGERKEKSADRLLTTREAAHLLNVSTRTLQRMRSEQRIGYVVLRGKCRYRQSEIDRLLEACAVNEDAATPQELKRNHTLRTGGKPKGRRT